MKLIPLDAVLAEIEKLMYAANLEADIASAEECFDEKVADAKYQLCKHFLSFLDTLEVKEVDLDFQRFAKEMDAIFALPSSETKNTEEEPLNWEYAVAKHFFELGVNASNPPTWEDINSILYIERLVLREFGGQEQSNEELCREVLKRFKVQKGE